MVEVVQVRTKKLSEEDRKIVRRVQALRQWHRPKVQLANDRVLRRTADSTAGSFRGGGDWGA